MVNKKGKSERKESLMRIPVLIVSGIILSFWKIFAIVLAITNFFYALFSGKRIKQLAEMSEIWNTQNYVFTRYTIFESNVRPFPFTKLQKSMSKFER